MANAFWGGFAGTLRDSRVKDEDAARQLDRDKALQELKKKYESEIVDSSQTTIEGTRRVMRNQFGDVISSTELTPDQIAAEKAKLAKVVAEGNRAVAEAEVSSKDAANYDADRQLSLEDKQLARQLQREQMAISRGHLGVAQRGLDIREREAKEAKADQVTALFFEAGDLGDASAMSLVEQYEMELDQANSEAERQRIIAKYLGQARNNLMKAKQANALELRKASQGGLDLTQPVVLPGN